MSEVTTQERQLYQQAIKKAGTAKTFDRILQVFVAVSVIGIAVFIAVTQLQYQAQSRRITHDRNDQLVRLLQANERTIASIRCAVQLRDTSYEADTAKLDECIARTEQTITQDSVEGQ